MNVFDNDDIELMPTELNATKVLICAVTSHIPLHIFELILFGPKYKAFYVLVLPLVFQLSMLFWDLI